MRAMAVGCSCTSLLRISSMVTAWWLLLLPPPLLVSNVSFRNGRITCRRNVVVLWEPDLDADTAAGSIDRRSLEGHNQCMAFSPAYPK